MEQDSFNMWSLHPESEFKTNMKQIVHIPNQDVYPRSQSHIRLAPIATQERLLLI